MHESYDKGFAIIVSDTKSKNNTKLIQHVFTAQRSHLLRHI